MGTGSQDLKIEKNGEADRTAAAELKKKLTDFRSHLEDHPS